MTSDLTSPDLTTSPLLSVKQAIPPVRPGAVRRTRLEERLDDPSAKLVTVVAPAGWGKTSLLSQWAARAAQGKPIAWVSLDDSDDEPLRFWSYVLTALRRAGDQISAAPSDALRAAAGPMALALPLLINELAASTTHHVLVLDDYHAITDRGVHESLEFLLSYLPPTGQVVIGSRWDPPLPLARMRARAELVEIRAAHLRFTPDEAASMVSTVSGVSEASAASSLWERTEGWPAGLQLAALTLRGSPEPVTAAARVRGDDRHLFDYFTAEVLPGLAPAQRDLLVRAAPLELLSGPLCDAALQVTGSAQVLSDLERADLFVVSLDSDREWYRCHRLLRDALQRGSESPNDAPASHEVLRQAAQWFEERDRIDDAVRHLRRAQDHAAAATLLQAHDSWFLDRGWAAAFLGHADSLPESVIEPQLALSLCYAAQLTGSRERVHHWLDVCDRSIDTDTAVVGWRSAEAAALMMRGIVTSADTDTALAVALCERAISLETQAGTQHHPVALAALGSVLALDGRYEEAVPILTEAVRRDASPWSRGLDLQLAGLLGVALLQLDRVDDLDRMLADAVPAADAAERSWGDAAAPVVAMLHLVQGRRRYQVGDLAQARSRLEQGTRSAEVAGRPWSMAIGLVYLADVEVAEGHRSTARVALVRAREVVDNEPTPSFVHRWLQAAETRIGRATVRQATRTGNLLEELTDREMSILRMLPGPATQREIGAALFLSINTVKAYNKSLYRKLGAGSRQEAVAAARHHGLI